MKQTFFQANAMMHSLKKAGAVTIALSALILASCSSGSGVATSPTTTVTGTAIAGAVDGTVVVRNAAGNQLATATVTAGAFKVSLADTAITSELDFEVTGTYTDEVSGSAVTLTASNPLALRTAANYFATSSNAPITPDTTIIRQLVANEGFTLANAEALFLAAFAYSPDMTAVPFDPTGALPAGATTADKNTAFLCGVSSQIGSDLGLDALGLAALPTALATDLSDGSFDGIGAGNPVTIATAGAPVNLAVQFAIRSMQARMHMATSKFAGNATKNPNSLPAPTMAAIPYHASGATKRVTLSDGVTQVDVTLTTPAMMPFMSGFKTARTRHLINLVDVNTGTPIDIGAPGAIITAVNQTPLMWMFSGHHHPSPKGVVTNAVDAVNGNYEMDTYYIMATAMMGGAPMGLWDYTVELTEAGGAVTSVIFQPNVMMPMGDTLYGSGSNAADQWSSMMGPTPRKYYAWLHSISGTTGNHNMTVFVSTQDMAMMAMSFPAVDAGSTLHDQAGAAFNILTVSVDASTDNGTTWQALTAAGNGLYSITGMTGLTSAAINPIQIRITVDINDGSGPLTRLDAGGNNPVLLFTAP